MTDTKLEIYVEKVLPADRRAELMRSLPSYIRPEVFERNLINALMANPRLINYDPRLIYREVSKAAAIGLLLDPILQEAYLVPGKDGVQLRIGYKGLMKLARISLNGAVIYAHEVCEHDFFKCSLGLDKRLEHEPDVFGERGEIIGYYAVIKFTDGSSADFETMSLREVRHIRDRSDGWKAFQANKIQSTPWSSDESEMGKKTVIRRLMKRQPQSTELAQAFAVEDAAEFPQHEKRGPGRPPRQYEPFEPERRSIRGTDDWKSPLQQTPPPPPEDDDGFPGDAHTADDVVDHQGEGNEG